MLKEHSELVNQLQQKNFELTALVDQLRASEERWRTIVRTEPECVKIVDPEGNLLEMNPAGLAMLDATTLEEVLSKPLLEWVVPEHREAFVQLHRQVMNGETGELEFEVIGLKGTRRWVHTHAAPLRDTNGAIISLLGISRDISGRRQLEEQLRQSQKMEAIGQLAGGIAHDFNNMLTVIQGFGLVVPEARDDPAETAYAAQQIVQAAERAATLTRQLLTFSRRQMMRPQVVDLNDIVTSVTKMLHRIVGEDVNLQLLLHSRHLKILADAGMMDQVLMNLAINARDAMPAGGTLTIETKDRFLTREDARGLPDLTPGSHACLRVGDTGCGISQEHLAHIFEPFFTTKDAGKGTGLGLATVFGIVAQHGGSISVDSVIGRGTVFEVLIPKTEAPSESRGAEIEAPKPRGGKETILVVEDEAAVRHLTRIVLERQGYGVLEASSGAEALRVRDNYAGRIDLVLTDLVMPEGMNGRQLAERLRQRDPGLRVIFTSGYSADFADKDLSLNEANFIPKPSSPKRILETIRRCLDS